MASFNETISFEHESEHVLEHDLAEHKNFQRLKSILPRAIVGETLYFLSRLCGHIVLPDYEYIFILPVFRFS